MEPPLQQAQPGHAQPGHKHRGHGHAKDGQPHAPLAYGEEPPMDAPQQFDGFEAAPAHPASRHKWPVGLFECKWPECAPALYAAAARSRPRAV